MIEEIINNLGNITENIIPSKEDMDNIINKIKNNEELDSYDILVLQKIKFCNHILKNKGERL